MSVLVIAGGGTGGHIFPGLAVAAQLEERGHAVHWLGARRGLEGELVRQHGIPITLVDVEGIQARSAAAAARAVLALPRAVAVAVHTLLRLKPAAVLGVGGYASAAGVAAAGLLGIPWVLQEQNAVPGLTNRLAAPFSDLICCGFADAVAAFPSLAAEWTGNPVRADFFTVPELEPHATPQILVLGGSQGSLFLNRILPQAVARLHAGGLPVAVRHQAGARWADVVRTSYGDLHLEADVTAFLAEPWGALAEADLVIARSGALTIAEMAAAGRGALLVPFAAAAGNHQEHNARALERAGGAVVLTETEARPDRVADTLAAMLTDAARLVQMARAARAVALPDAAERITTLLLGRGGVA